MWRVKFQRRGGGELITRNGTHNIEAAAFYAEAILAKPEAYILVEPNDGNEISAAEALPEYEVVDYWKLAKRP